MPEQQQPTGPLEPGAPQSDEILSQPLRHPLRERLASLREGAKTTLVDIRANLLQRLNRLFPTSLRLALAIEGSQHAQERAHQTEQKATLEGGYALQMSRRRSTQPLPGSEYAGGVPAKPGKTPKKYERKRFGDGPVWALLGDPDRIAINAINHPLEKDNQRRTRYTITSAVNKVVKTSLALTVDNIRNALTFKSILTGIKSTMHVAGNALGSDSTGRVFFKSIPIASLITSYLSIRKTGSAEQRRLAWTELVTDLVLIGAPTFISLTIPIPFVNLIVAGFSGFSVGFGPSFFLDFYANKAASRHQEQTSRRYLHHMHDLLTSTDPRLRNLQISNARNLVDVQNRAVKKNGNSIFKTLALQMQLLNPGFVSPLNKERRELNDRLKREIAEKYSAMQAIDAKGWIGRLLSAPKRATLGHELDELEWDKYNLIDRPFMEALQLHEIIGKANYWATQRTI